LREVGGCYYHATSLFANPYSKYRTWNVKMHLFDVSHCSQKVQGWWMFGHVQRLIHLLWGWGKENVLITQYETYQDGDLYLELPEGADRA
jgi:hypothetical protein